jgi:two-component system sensor histidine kinase KdpD
MSLLCGSKKPLTGLIVGDGTLDAHFRCMASIIPSKSPLRADSFSQPNLRLVANEHGDRLAIARTPEQLPRTAVIACLSAHASSNGELLPKASAAARVNHGQFYAVFVDSPRTRLGKADVQALVEDAVLASYLGAKIVWLESSDVVGELLRFASQSRVGRVFVTRNRPALFPRLFDRAVYPDLLNRAEGFRIDVVGFERGKLTSQ